MSEATSVEVITADVINQQALHSMQVMEQWGNGEVYNEATWIERGRQAVVKTLEGMFELGKTLIVLKEHTEHGRFREIAEQELGLHSKEVTRLMNATKRFATPQMQKAQPKLIGLGKSKLLELLVEDDDTLVELAEGGDINGNTLDDIDRMTRNELRVALREAREDNKAKDRLITEKGEKIDELNIELDKKKQNLLKPAEPADITNGITVDLIKVKQTVRSELGKLREIFANLITHGETYGFDHTALMVGVINQLILDCEILRGQYLLPTDAPTGEVPVWLTDDDDVQTQNEQDVPLPFDYEDDEV